MEIIALVFLILVPTGVELARAPKVLTVPVAEASVTECLILAPTGAELAPASKVLHIPRLAAMVPVVLVV